MIRDQSFSEELHGGKDEVINIVPEVEDGPVSGFSAGGELFSRQYLIILEAINREKQFSLKRFDDFQFRGNHFIGHFHTDNGENFEFAGLITGLELKDLRIYEN